MSPREFDALTYEEQVEAMAWSLLRSRPPKERAQAAQQKRGPRGR